MNILIVGDAHFSEKNILDLKIVEKEILSMIANVPELDMIVGLGDWMNDFGKISLKSYTACHEFIMNLSKRCKKFVMLIGNHDRVNNQHDPENMHIFTSLKLLPNMLVVDEPIVWEQNGVKFGALPYLPPHDFYKLTPAEFFDGSIRLCFSHQEFKGCLLNKNNVSKDGSEIREMLPTMISGHIHGRHNIGRVYYPGTPYQQNFSEDPDKSVTACFIYPATPEQASLRDFIESTETPHQLSAQGGTIVLQNLLFANIPRKYTYDCELQDLGKYKIEPMNHYRFRVHYNIRDDLYLSATYQEYTKNPRIKLMPICREVMQQLKIPTENRKSFMETLLESARSEEQLALLKTLSIG
jgi:predicted phosphodiesterase